MGFVGFYKNYLGISDFFFFKRTGLCFFGTFRSYSKFTLIESGYWIVIRRSYRNIFITLVDVHGKVYLSFSAGRILRQQQRRRFRGRLANRSRRSSLPVFCSLIRVFLYRVRLLKITSVSVVLTSYPNFMIRVFFQFLKNFGIRILSVKFKCFGPHNGCKRPKIRRI